MQWQFVSALKKVETLTPCIACWWKVTIFLCQWTLLSGPCTKFPFSFPHLSLFGCNYSLDAAILLIPALQVHVMKCVIMPRIIVPASGLGFSDFFTSMWITVAKDQIPSNEVLV